MKVTSLFLVLIQFFCIGWFLFTNHYSAFQWYHWLVLSLSLVVGFTAIGNMNLNNFTVMPELKHNARFVKKGMYSFIRHPMYLAVMLICLPSVLQKTESIHYILYCILAIVLMIKIEREEIYLANQFSAYKSYQSTTKKLIPYVY